MNISSSLQKSAWLGAITATLAGAPLQAADLSISPQPGDNSNLLKHAAMIVAVDKEKGELTLHSKGANYLYTLSPQAVDLRTHQPITIDELTTGDLVSFTARPQSGPLLQIVSLVVLNEPVGGSSGGGNSSAGAKVNVPTPPAPPAPGPVVSPYQ